MAHVISYFTSSSSTSPGSDALVLPGSPRAVPRNHQRSRQPLDPSCAPRSTLSDCFEPCPLLMGSSWHYCRADTSSAGPDRVRSSAISPDRLGPIAPSSIVENQATTDRCRTGCFARLSASLASETAPRLRRMKLVAVASRSLCSSRIQPEMNQKL